MIIAYMSFCAPKGVGMQSYAVFWGKLWFLALKHPHKRSTYALALEKCTFGLQANHIDRINLNPHAGHITDIVLDTVCTAVSKNAVYISGAPLMKDQMELRGPWPQTMSMNASAKALRANEAVESKQ